MQKAALELLLHTHLACARGRGLPCNRHAHRALLVLVRRLRQVHEIRPLSRRSLLLLHRRRRGQGWRRRRRHRLLRIQLPQLLTDLRSAGVQRAQGRRAES